MIMENFDELIFDDDEFLDDEELVTPDTEKPV